MGTALYVAGNFETSGGNSRWLYDGYKSGTLYYGINDFKYYMVDRKLNESTSPNPTNYVYSPYDVMYSRTSYTTDLKCGTVTAASVIAAANVNRYYTINVPWLTTLVKTYMEPATYFDLIPANWVASSPTCGDT